MIDQLAIRFGELAEAARARAAFCDFINLHFLTLVDQPFVTRLRNGELSSVLIALEQDETNDADMAAGAGLMLDYLEKTREMDLVQLVQELGVERTRLYRGVAKGYGPPPPYEMVWSEAVGDSGVLQTISGIYRKEGLEPSSAVKERLDYISVEIDFLRELALQEANAWEFGDQETAIHLFETQQDFLSHHLGVWIPDFIDNAFAYVKTDFYQGHLLMLRGFIQSEQQRFEMIANALND